MIRNILLLCTGNICRSPMAEGLFRELLPMHDVFSAGLSTMEGSPADQLAIELMWQSGIDISEHRSRNLASWMMREADLVFTMDSAQTQFVIRRYPVASKKVERLGEPCGLDIPDPYQHGLSAFCHSLRLIERAVSSATIFDMAVGAFLMTQFGSLQSFGKCRCPERVFLFDSASQAGVPVVVSPQIFRCR